MPVSGSTRFAFSVVHGIAVIARQFRLREEYDIRRTRSRGIAISSGPVVARILPNSLEPLQNRYAVIAGKRCGSAVERNRVKRLLREALRGYHPHLLPGTDFAIVCRGTANQIPTLGSAQQALHTIFTKANLWKPNTSPPNPGSPITTGWTSEPENLEVS